MIFHRNHSRGVTQTLVTSSIVKEHLIHLNVDRYKFVCATFSRFHHCRDQLKLQETGGASRDRTDDPLLAKQVLSQLS